MTINPFTEVLKQKSFRNLWISQILSQLTQNLVNYILILRVFEATKSSVAVSLVWTFYAIPAIIVGPFVGTFTDIYEKKRILFLTTLAEAFIVFFYLLFWGHIWSIYTVIFIYSLVFQFYIPAEAAMLPSTVNKKMLPLANSLFLFTVYGTVLVGYSLAGPLIRVVGREVPFLISSLLFLIAAYSVSRLPNSPHVKRIEIKFEDFFERFREGYSFLKKERRVLYPLLLMAMVQVIISLLSVLAPSFATDILNADLLDAGLILILPAGLGAVAAAFILIRLIPKQIRKKKIVTFGLFTLAGTFLAMSALIPLITYGKVIISTFLVFMLGVGLVSVLLPVQTLIQETTPDEFRGRVFGVLGLLITLASVLPMLFAASLADVLGVGIIMGVLSAAVFVIAINSLREPYEIYNHHWA